MVKSVVVEPVETTVMKRLLVKVVSTSSTTAGVPEALEGPLDGVTYANNTRKLRNTV